MWCHTAPGDGFAPEMSNPWIRLFPLGVDRKVHPNTVSECLNWWKRICLKLIKTVAYFKKSLSGHRQIRRVSEFRAQNYRNIQAGVYVAQIYYRGIICLSKKSLVGQIWKVGQRIWVSHVCLKIWSGPGRSWQKQDELSGMKILVKLTQVSTSWKEEWTKNVSKKSAYFLREMFFNEMRNQANNQLVVRTF